MTVILKVNSIDVSPALPSYTLTNCYIIFNKDVQLFEIDKIKVHKINELQIQLINNWHNKEELIHSWEDAKNILAEEYNGILRLVHDNQLINCFQWHEEDKARIPDVQDSFIAQIKRIIDISNQRRNDKIEEIDAALVAVLAEKVGILNNDIPINSETPGSIIDRLSILALKIYHMKQEVKRIDVKPDKLMLREDKLKILLEQQDDLSLSFTQLINELMCGKKRLKVYYQCKMYNDPDTNPAIYLKNNINK